MKPTFDPKLEGAPRHIQVMGQVYTVDYVPKIHLQKDDGTSRDLAGLTESDSQLITLAMETIGPDYGREVYLHECLHAIFATVSIDDLLSDVKEETLVSRISAALLQFLVDNPRVVTFLTRRPR